MPKEAPQETPAAAGQDLAFQASLLAHLNHAVIATDLKGNITHWNPCAESLYQWKSEEVIGRNIFDVTVPQEHRAEGHKILEQVARSGTWGGEFWVQRKDGSRFPALITDAVVRDSSGAITGYVGVSLDLTPHLHVDRERQMLIEVADNSPDFVGITGPDQRMLFVNEAGRKMLGLAGMQDVFQTSILDYFMPEDRDHIRQFVLPALQRDGLWDGEVRFRHFQTGEPLWMSWNAFTIPGAESCAPAVIACVSRNITQQKKTEQQSRQSQKLQSLGVLTGGIAHDFNNLLVGILGNATLARETLASMHQAEPVLDEVILASERASQLTKQLLDYAEKAPAVTKPVDLSRLSKENVRLLRTSISANTELEFNLAPDLPLIVGDAGAMQMVVMNLILNAIEAVHEKRSGLVRVSTGIEQFDRTAAAHEFPDRKLSSGEYVFFEVQDNGNGMDERIKAQIFEPFFTTKYSGRGLGLSAVQDIVRAHRGAIKVDSAVGEGSTFRVVLPVQPAPSPR